MFPMDVEILSRIQFAFTIAFHYIYPTFSIGLGLFLVIVQLFWLKTRRPIYHNMARFWTRIFGLTFAVGVASGNGATSTAAGRRREGYAVAAGSG